MTLNDTLPTVAVLNNNEDLLDLLSRFLIAEGYVAVTLCMLKVKNGEVDIAEFIEKHNPQIVIYDIAFPYRENWKQCENVRQLEICKERKFILTTPNIDALEQMVGKQIGALQIVDRDVDLKKIVDLVNGVWKQRHGQQSSAPIEPVLPFNSVTNKVS